jgi:hypothetical protein
MPKHYVMTADLSEVLQSPRERVARSLFLTLNPQFDLEYMWGRMEQKDKDWWLERADLFTKLMGANPTLTSVEAKSR